MVLSTAAFAALLLAVGGIPATGKPAHHKPDLDLVHAALKGEDFALTGKRADIEVKDTTQNTGHAPAGSTVNELDIRGHGDKYTHTTRAVPKLKPGESSSDTGTARIDIPDNAKPGAYEAELCVDAKDQENEEDELDNCHNIGRFYIIKPRWEGTLKVTGPGSPFGGAKEVGVMDHAVYNNPKENHEGSFQYKLQGTVQYTTSGTDSGGCNFSGSMSDDSPSGTLTLVYIRGVYVGNATTAKRYTLSDPPCNDPGLQGPLEAAFLITTNLHTGENEPLGSGNHLGGTNRVQGDIWTWSLNGGS